MMHRIVRVITCTTPARVIGLLLGSLMTIHAQTSYNLTVQAGPLRHTFAGFGTSHASTRWDNIATTPRNIMADMIYRDLRMNAVRLWTDNFESNTVTQLLKTFNTTYIASGAITDIKSRGVATLLLAPTTGSSAGHTPPASIPGFADKLGEFILQLKNTYNVAIDVTGICNEPGTSWSKQNVVDCVKYLRSSLNSRGLSSVKIIAPETSSHAAATGYVDALNNDADAWTGLHGVASHSYGRVLYNDDLARLKKSKTWWMTEASDGGAERAEDENRASTVLARYVSEMNHGVNEWIFFIGLGQVSDISTYPLGTAFMVLYDQRTSNIVPLLKYYYFKQALSTFDVGCIFRKSVSATEGDMFCVSNQNPAIVAAAAYNPDGSWGINVVNETGITGSPAASDSFFYPATTYNVTLTVEELTNSASTVFLAYRSRANSHFVSSGTVTLINGIGTFSIAPREIVSLRSASTPGAVPPTPSGLIASTYTGPVVLNWNNTVKATGWNVKRATASGGLYTRVATTTTTRYEDTSALNGEVYRYVVSATNAFGESAHSHEVTCSPTPVMWTNADIGDVGIAGSCAVSDGGTYTTYGAGTALGTTLDSFNFTYRSMTGDGTLMARIPKAASALTKVGIMMSETLGTAPKAVAVIYNFNGSWLQAMRFARTTAGNTGQWAGSTITTVPTWFKLERRGNTFTGYASNDGSTWTMFSPTTISMPGTIYVGLVNSSSSTSYLNQATFDNVNTPSAPPENLVGSMDANGAGITLGWTACLGATSYNIKRAVLSGGPYTTIGTTSSPTIGYIDGTVAPGTTYYYVVSAVNAMGESANSVQANVTLPFSFGVPCGLTAILLPPGQIMLTWTNNLTNVYHTPTLAAPVTWALLTNRPVFSNGQWAAALPIGTNSCGFYRLQH